MSYPDLKDLNGRKELFAGVAASQFSPMSLMVGAEPEWVWGQIVTANFFDVLGVRPALGRTLLPDEETRPGGHPVVVLSHSFWQRRFKGDSNIIGATISLNRHPFTIVGVAAAGFRGTMGGLAFDLWAPVMMRDQLTPGGWNPDLFQARNNRWLHTVARLAPGVGVKQVQAAVDTLAQQWDQEYPASNRDIRYSLVPMWKSPWGAPRVLLPLLSVMFAVTVLVLLIVSANIANLLLARATSREREIAVRLALGAGRRRVIRQLLTESVLLALLGGAVGIPLAAWLTDFTQRLLPTFYLPVVLNPELDIRGLIFMSLVAAGTGVLFGLAPALQSTRPNLVQCAQGRRPRCFSRAPLVAGHVGGVRNRAGVGAAHRRGTLLPKFPPCPCDESRVRPAKRSAGEPASRCSRLRRSGRQTFLPPVAGTAARTARRASRESGGVRAARTRRRQFHAPQGGRLRSATQRVYERPLQRGVSRLLRDCAHLAGGRTGLRGPRRRFRAQRHYHQ